MMDSMSPAFSIQVCRLCGELIEGTHYFGVWRDESGGELCQPHKDSNGTMLYPPPDQRHEPPLPETVTG